MSTLTQSQRNAMPQSEYALPGKKYPVNDLAHAVNAKARATQMEEKGKLSAGQAEEVKAKANKVLGRKMARALSK
ncbi:MAG: hypothetical protein KGI54_17490 [Pseudomonadota bacterium]|nr:hypothetical protein [Pseudomonadota bacterium]